MSSASPPTLRLRLLRTVLVPLAATWVVGTIVSLGVAQHFSQRAFDRSLLDDAYLLSTHMRLSAGKLQMDLTPAEANAVLFDQAEKMYFSVRSPDGRVLAGDPALDVPHKGSAAYGIVDILFDGRVLRAVTLHAETPAPFEVVVAQTTSSRDAALRQLLLYALLPQLLLLLPLALWLRRSIGRDVQPLADLRRLLEGRGSHDLAPLPAQSSTHDVQSLTGAINALLQRLERSIRAQKEFAGNVAHELRTPLAGIRALADYGLAHEAPAVWREQLAAIAASEARATSLVDRLLALAVAAEAESSLHLQPIALDEVVRECVLRFLPQADARGVDLGARGIDAPAWVSGERTLLEGMLNNLLDNALRYGVSGPELSPTVTVAVEQGTAEVILSVQDNGPGVPRDQQVALVARGIQGEAGQLLREGAGLGLALVAQYARLMGARMALRGGEGGRGWVCEVRFPALPAAPA